MRIYKVRTKRELLECDEFLAQHGPLNGPPASTQQATWACRSGKVLVAVCCACTTQSLDGTVLAHLTNCAVHSDMRGQGLQTDLVETRVAWARRKRAKHVLTHTWNTNVASMINLIKAGFEPYCVEGEHVSFRRAL